MKKTPLIILVAAIVIAIVPAFSSSTNNHRHALVGCWQGSDSTVFIFRNDGSFVGRDYLGRRIWGSWSALNDRQIGFQALYHSGSYAPEYAETLPGGRMRYACPDNNGFIGCVAIDYDNAIRQVDRSKLNQMGGS